jgi:hypothetical protein
MCRKECFWNGQIPHAAPSFTFRPRLESCFQVSVSFTGMAIQPPHERSDRCMALHFDQPLG